MERRSKHPTSALRAVFVVRDADGVERTREILRTA